MDFSIPAMLTQTEWDKKKGLIAKSKETGIGAALQAVKTAYDGIHWAHFDPSACKNLLEYATAFDKAKAENVKVEALRAKVKAARDLCKEWETEFKKNLLTKGTGEHCGKMFKEADVYWIKLKNTGDAFNAKEKEIKEAGEELQYFITHRKRAVEVGKRLRAASERALVEARKDVKNAKNILVVIESEKDQKIAKDLARDIADLAKKAELALAKCKSDFDTGFASDDHIMAVRGNPKHGMIKPDLEKVVTFQESLKETDAVNKANDQLAATLTELQALAGEADDAAGASSRGAEEWKKAALDLVGACTKEAKLVQDASEKLDGKGKQVGRYEDMLKETDQLKLTANKKILVALEKEIEKQWSSYESTLVGFNATYKRMQRIPPQARQIDEIGNSVGQIEQLNTNVNGFKSKANEAKLVLDEVFAKNK